MVSIIVCLVWGIVVLFSFASLGRILARILKPDIRPDPFLAAGWGMAGMIIFGGLLNLVGFAQSRVLIAFVSAIILIDLILDRYATRVGIAAGEPARTPGDPPCGKRLQRWDAIWIAALALLVTTKFISSFAIIGTFFDDKPAYLPQAVRMLQTGSIGANPFSERQLMSLNGQTTILGLFLSVCPTEYGYLFDPGMCWIFIAGIVWNIIRREYRAPIVTSCLLTALVMMMDDPQVVNLAGQLSGSVLCLTLVRTAYLGSTSTEKRDFGSLILLALSVAGLWPSRQPSSCMPSFL